MRISRSVLREAGGETPPAYSPVIRGQSRDALVLSAKIGSGWSATFVVLAIEKKTSGAPARLRSCSTRLEQEPNPALRQVDPVLQQAGGCNIVCLIA